MSFTDAITVHPDGVSINLDITPGAKQTRIQGYNPWRKRIEMHVQAPAHRGAANKELVHVLASIFNTSPQNIYIQTGSTVAKKTLRIRNIQPEAVVKTLQRHIQG